MQTVDNVTVESPGTEGTRGPLLQGRLAESIAPKLEVSIKLSVLAVPTVPEKRNLVIVKTLVLMVKEDEEWDIDHLSETDECFEEATRDDEE
ncbi:unnamed protein product [Caretta caretta]